MHPVIQSFIQERIEFETKLTEVGWMVSKDIINTKWNDPSIKGKQYGNYKGGKHRIRLLDDDGTVYFYLYSDENYNTSELDADVLFYPLDSLGKSYGCTELQYKTPTGEYKTL